MSANKTSPAPSSTLTGLTEQIFPWTRFWVPANGQIQMGSFWDTTEGYLADPEAEFFGKISNKHLLKTEALFMSQSGCIVLWGEPGMGKSQTLRSFLGGTPPADTITIEFRDIPDSGRFERVLLNSPVWIKWSAGSGLLTVVVDGVDEGLIKITGFVNYLAALLRNQPVSRLQLVLACRSLEWPASEGLELLSLWPSPLPADSRSGIFELCPLRDQDVRQAAGIVLADGPDSKTVNGFMRALHQHQLIGLATRPLTLRMLLHEFATGRRFSKSQRELYRRFSHLLCDEPDPVRQRRLRDIASQRLQVSSKVRERMAGRIASLLLLCGRSAIWTGRADEASSTDLTVDEICEGSEHVDGMELSVERYMAETVLESPLFWAKGIGRVGFYHQTFAESLAAEYLRKLPFPQLRSLLCQRDRHGEFVHPPLAELAAWIAAEAEGFLAHLLQHDPETLLRSDVSGIKETHRAELVAAVLRKAQASELFDTRGLERFFHTLKHPGLAEQLRTVIADRSANQVVRRIALRMAERCALTELFDDVFARVRDPRDTKIHSMAAATLDDLADFGSAQRLAKFIARKGGRRLAAGVHMSLLHATLKHGAWTVSEAIPFFAPALQQLDSSSSGLILAQHVQLGDTEALLRACLQWPGCFDQLSPYHALVGKAHDGGVARIHETAIRCLLARVWWQARLKDVHHSFVSTDREAPKLMDVLRGDSVLRRTFIDDLVSLGAFGSGNQWVLAGDLTNTDDFPHFLVLAESGALAKRMVYARLAGQIYDFIRHAAYWDQLLSTLGRSAELRSVFSWLREWTLDAPDSLQQKELHYESLRWWAEAEKKRPKKPKQDPVKVWTRDLDLEHVGKGKPEDWLNLAYNLFFRGDEAKMEDELRVDLRTSPGWKYHDEAGRKKIVAGAYRMIVEVPGNPHHQLGGQSDFDRLAYRALYLLKDEIEGSPELATAVRRSWLPTIFDELSNAEEHHMEMVALSYRLDPAAVCALLKAKTLQDATREGGITIELREFARCWNQSLAGFVVEMTATDIINAVTVHYIMQYLAEHDPEAGRQLWLRLKATRKKHPKRYAAGLSALASWRLFDFWDQIWPELKADQTLAKDVLVGIDVHDQRNFLNRSKALTERRLADLYLLMREVFPPSEDPAVPIGRTYTPTRRMEISRLREELPTVLAAMGTEAAADELERIAKTLPSSEAIWMRWRMHDAVVALRRKTWQSPTTNLVVSLVHKSNRRWLTDEADLLALVQESIGRLQDNLTRQPNSLRRDFWCVRKVGGRTKYLVPCDEVDMSRRIATWLQSDLAKGRGITVQREVQIQWNKRTDIEIRAVAIAGDELRPLEITLEVKGCWHPKVRSALKDQLVDDYLASSGRTHGFYIVVWTTCARWKDPRDKRRLRWKLKTLRATQEEVEKLAAGYDGLNSPFVVRATVLDARL